MCRCNIFHDDADSVQLPGLPPAWDDASGAAVMHAVELPCGHSYNVSALAVHFLSHDMRCPVCRAGHLGRMHIHSLPEPLRAAFSSMAPVASPAPMPDSTEVQASDIEPDLRLTAEAGFVHEHGSVTCISTTRLQRTSVSVQDADFSLHRCFRRALDTFLSRHAYRADMYLRFYLDHPLFDEVISTEKVVISEMKHGHVYLLNLPPQPVGTTQHPLSVGHLQYIHTSPFSVDAGLHIFAAHIHTEHVVAICVQQMHSLMTDVQ